MPEATGGSRSSVSPRTGSMGSGLIGGTLGFLSNMIGFGAQRRAEKRQREYEQQMYQTQKKDRIDFWNMENMYNSPEMQMQRLKKAGLNPNLVYGNGATAMGGSISAPNADISNQSPNTVPYMQGMANSVGSVLNQMYDLRIKDAQANLLQAQEKTEIQNEILRTFQALNETIENEKGNTDLNYYRKEKKELFKQLKIATRQALENTNKTRTEIDLSRTNIDYTGSKKQGQDIQNQMDEQQLNMYKSLGLPPQLIDQLLKTAPFLAPFLNYFKKGNGKTK